MHFSEGFRLIIQHDYNSNNRVERLLAVFPNRSPGQQRENVAKGTIISEFASEISQFVLIQLGMQLILTERTLVQEV